MNSPWTSRDLTSGKQIFYTVSTLPTDDLKMLFFYPFMTILLSQLAVSAPAPAPGPLPLVDNPSLKHLFHELGTYVKRIFGSVPRDQDYGSYGGYGKYGSYGSYPDLGGEASNEASSNVNDELQPESIQTMTTTMPIFTTTITLRSMSTPTPTITAVSIAHGQMSTRTYQHGGQEFGSPIAFLSSIWLSFVLET
jgi:hypothetical protein